jgi:hypothetical protein
MINPIAMMRTRRYTDKIAIVSQPDIRYRDLISKLFSIVERSRRRRVVEIRSSLKA